MCLCEFFATLVKSDREINQIKKWPVGTVFTFVKIGDKFQVLKLYA